ncbi:MAG: histidine phosphatase family protein [Alphaproteobacteria bacterium]|nr:histidine phosphatase family protein [Alphaproteobacteria bacterium]
MTQRYIFARHGQSEANAQRRMSGHADTPLTALGRQQARLLGEAIAEAPITRAFASDLSRASETARLALGARPLALETHFALRERCVGAWSGELRADLRRDGRMNTLLTWQGRPPEGESQQDMALRVLGWFVALPPIEEGVTLVVAHGGVLRAIFGLLDGDPLDQIGFSGVQNAAPHPREVDRDAWARALERAQG